MISVSIPQAHDPEPRVSSDRVAPPTTIVRVSTTYAKRAASDAERKKFLAVVDLFRKYGDRYEMDFLLMAAQGYQESHLGDERRFRIATPGPQ